MTAEDVRSVTFEPVRKGYRPEDVDDFLLQVATDMQRLEAERDTALAERAAIVAEQNALITERDNAAAAKEDAESKMYVLAGKVEEYRGQEDTLKTALINAQRMGETVVYEAKQKADHMLREATGQAELLRQSAEQEAEKERATLERLQGEVKNFKTTILNLYKQHIESLSALDPPVDKVEKVLEANPPKTVAATDQAMLDDEEWDNQALNIQIPGPPSEEPSDVVPAQEPVVEEAAPVYEAVEAAPEYIPQPQEPLAPAPEDTQEIPLAPQ